MKNIPLVVIALHLFATLALFYFHPHEKQNISKKVTVKVLTRADRHVPSLTDKGVMDERKEPLVPFPKAPKDKGSLNPTSRHQNWDAPGTPPAPHPLQGHENSRHVPIEKPLLPKTNPTPHPPYTVRPPPTPRVIPHPKIETPTAKPTPHPTLSMQKNSQSQLIANLEKSLKALNKTPSSEKVSEKSASSAPLPTLASEQLSFETNYEEDLIAYLETILCLPEKGEVKIKLDLQKKGSVKKIEIIQSTSERNENYVKTALESTFFPPLSKEFKNQDSHIFTITLRSKNSD